MLVLSRKVGERILIGDNIAITVVRVAQGTVRLGVDAPDNLIVVREEVVNPTPSTDEVVNPTPSTEEAKEVSPKKKSKTSKRK